MNHNGAVTAGRGDASIKQDVATWHAYIDLGRRLRCGRRIRQAIYPRRVTAA